LRTEINQLVRKAQDKVLALQEVEGNVIDVEHTEAEKEQELTPESLIEELGKEG
jgi:hypothetical protein